jgi:hypothetical protein
MDTGNAWQGLTITISSVQWKIFHDKYTDRTEEFNLETKVSAAITEEFKDKRFCLIYKSS